LSIPNYHDIESFSRNNGVCIANANARKSGGFAEEDGEAIGGEGGFVEEFQFRLFEDAVPLFGGPRRGFTEAHEKGEFGSVVVFVEVGRGGGFDEEEVAFGKVFGNAGEDFGDAVGIVAGVGILGGGFGEEIGGDEAVEFVPELVRDADAIEDAARVGAGFNGIGGDSDEAFFEL